MICRACPTPPHLIPRLSLHVNIKPLTVCTASNRELGGGAWEHGYLRTMHYQTPQKYVLCTFCFQWSLVDILSASRKYIEDENKQNWQRGLTLRWGQHACCSTPETPASWQIYYFVLIACWTVVSVLNCLGNTWQSSTYESDTMIWHHTLTNVYTPMIYPLVEHGVIWITPWKPFRRNLNIRLQDCTLLDYFTLINLNTIPIHYERDSWYCHWFTDLYIHCRKVQFTNSVWEL